MITPGSVRARGSATPDSRRSQCLSVSDHYRGRLPRAYDLGRDDANPAGVVSAGPWLVSRSVWAPVPALVGRPTVDRLHGGDSAGRWPLPRAGDFHPDGRPGRDRRRRIHLVSRQHVSKLSGQARTVRLAQSVPLAAPIASFVVVRLLSSPLAHQLTRRVERVREAACLIGGQHRLRGVSGCRIGLDPNHDGTEVESVPR